MEEACRTTNFISNLISRYCRIGQFKKVESFIGKSARPIYIWTSPLFWKNSTFQLIYLLNSAVFFNHSNSSLGQNFEAIKSLSNCDNLRTVVWWYLGFQRTVFHNLNTVGKLLIPLSRSIALSKCSISKQSHFYLILDNTEVYVSLPLWAVGMNKWFRSQTTQWFASSKLWTWNISNKRFPVIRQHRCPLPAEPDTRIPCDLYFLL